jgi:hypothetical protein
MRECTEKMLIMGGLDPDFITFREYLEDPLNEELENENNLRFYILSQSHKRLVEELKENL